MVVEIGNGVWGQELIQYNRLLADLDEEGALIIPKDVTKVVDIHHGGEIIHPADGSNPVRVKDPVVEADFAVLDNR